MERPKILFIDHIQREQFDDEKSLVYHQESVVFDLEEFAQRFNDDHEKIGRIEIVDSEGLNKNRQVKRLINELKLEECR